MRAAQRLHYGPPSVIRVESLPRPEPGANELLVRVVATTVSRTDCALLSAKPFVMRFIAGLTRPKRAVLGTDFAGRVEAVGADVEGFAVGDRVFGINDMGLGTQAEYAAIPADDAVATIPDGTSFAAAAAALEGAWYAQSIVERASLRRGSRVLINGATGAIGSALLQLCVDLDARVTAVGNTKNLALLESLGAEAVIDYERDDFTKRPGPYDYVFDAVGKSTFGASRRLLAAGGVYCSTELGPGAQNLLFAATTPLFRRRRVVFPVPVDRKAFLPVLCDLLARGRLKPVIDRAYALDDVRDAYAYAGSGQKTGGVLLRLADEE
ncbi:MAG: NAD(P)-dependent alcohol dehydrogenase [Myxococcales bacterium]|nr:NAD(P)-dependent alcohol dehydrogenase [Myxococcales bacterium]